MNEQNNPILEVKNLRVSYHTYAGEVKAVRGVQFSLEKGQALAIVGESGCGKSVTAKSIMGLIKAPQGEIKENSEILYHGENILKYNKKQWQHYKGGECAIIFQDALASLNHDKTGSGKGSCRDAAHGRHPGAGKTCQTVSARILRRYASACYDRDCVCLRPENSDL